MNSEEYLFSISTYFGIEITVIAALDLYLWFGSWVVSGKFSLDKSLGSALILLFFKISSTLLFFKFSVICST
mgnify:CR=1 FL=1